MCFCCCWYFSMLLLWKIEKSWIKYWIQRKTHLFIKTVESKKKTWESFYPLPQQPTINAPARLAGNSHECFWRFEQQPLCFIRYARPQQQLQQHDEQNGNILPSQMKIISIFCWLHFLEYNFFLGHKKNIGKQFFIDSLAG